MMDFKTVSFPLVNYEVHLIIALRDGGLGIPSNLKFAACTVRTTNRDTHIDLHQVITCTPSCMQPV